MRRRYLAAGVGESGAVSAKQRAAHARLAAFFGQAEYLSDRVVAELPYQVRRHFLFRCS